VSATARAARAVVSVLILAVAAGCGGATPYATRPPASVSTTLGTVNAYLTAFLDGYTVTATVPPPTAGAGATLTMTLSKSAPSGVSPAATTRTTLATTTQHGLLYIVLSASAALTLPNLPALSIIQTTVDSGPEGIAEYETAGLTLVEGPLDGSKTMLPFTAPAPAEPLAMNAGTPVDFVLLGNLASASPTPSPSPSPTPPSPGVLSLQPTQVNLDGIGQTGTLAIAETGYSGAFTVTGTCGGATPIASLTAAGPGPTTSLTVTAQTSGQCTVSVADAYGQMQSATVVVSSSQFGLH
jgi:hypothetical protein